MKLHRKKMTAPIIISAIVVFYYLAYFCLLITLIDGIWKYVLGIIPVVLAAVMIKVCMLVKGSTIQSKNIGKDISQSFKTLVGGELKAYNEMMNDARALATKRMVAEAEALGADAIVNIRYSSSSVMQGAAEVIVYGTAVKFIEE